MKTNLRDKIFYLLQLDNDDTFQIIANNPANFAHLMFQKRRDLIIVRIVILLLLLVVKVFRYSFFRGNTDIFQSL